MSTIAGIAWFDGFQWNRLDGTAGAPARNPIYIRGEYRDSILINSAGMFYLGTRNGFRPFFRRVGDSFVNTDGKPIRSAEQALLSEFFRDSLGGTQSDEFVKKITGFFRTRTGTLWVTIPDGLYLRDGNRWKARMSRGRNQLPFRILSVSQNRTGSGICLVRGPTEQMGMWEWASSDVPHPSKLGKSILYIVSADLDEEGNAVAAAQSGEMFVRHNGLWSTFPFVPEHAKNITSVYFRRSGDLCIGSDDGVYVWRRAFDRWAVLPPSPLELKNYINEILMTREGDLWIGSGNGLEVRHPDGRVEDIASINGRRIMNITGLQQDNNGDLWISSGSSFDGAYRWDRRSWRYYPVTTDPNGIYIHKIRKDRHGRLWFLGLGHNVSPSDADQIGAYVLEEGGFTRWGQPEGLPSGRVYAFDEASDGSLWFATHKGISRWRAGSWTHWTVATGLRQDHVFCLAIDHEGEVWFGHMTTNGLGHINAHDSVQYFGIEDGIPDNRIYDIRVDSTGVVWIASRGGLCSYDHGTWAIFDEKSGLVSNALWPVLPLRDEVYVGTTGRGIAKLRRDEGIGRYPIILIQKPIVEDRDALVRWESYAFYGEVMPENSITRYRVNGGKWSSWTTMHEVSLPHLDHGSYSINVQGKGLYGQFNPEPAGATFTILPPLYLRPVIYLPGAAAVSTLVVLLTLLQVRRIRHRRELEKSEERYRLITELMSDYAYLYKLEAEGRRTVLWITESFTRLTGFPPEEFKKDDFNERFYHPDHQTAIRRAMKIVSSGKPESFEVRVLTRSGKEKWIHNHVAPIWNRDKTVVTHIYGIARDITRRKQDEEQMRKLATELALTEERERRRMATFLHDSISQTLAFCKIKLRMLERGGPEKRTDGALAEIRALVEDSLENTRSLTFELSPPALHELGVSEALRSLAERLFGQHEIHLEFSGAEIANRLPNEMGTVLYYSVRETFINIIKHAHATAVSVSVCLDASSIRVAVRDNGIGIQLEGSAAAKGDSFGLLNIRERLMHLGGSLEIGPQTGGGTSVVLTVPIDSTFSPTTLPT